MAQALDVLDRLLSTRDSAFRCTAAGDRSGKRSFVARLRHEAGPPASRAALAELRRFAGARAGDAQPLYERHDGLRLYADTLSPAAAVVLFPIAEWAARTEGLREDWSHLSAEDDPERLLSGIAVGEPPQSGDSFVWVREGPRAGAVFHLAHSDWPEGPFALDFAGFVARLVQDPVALIDGLGSYARYRDGRTDAQWIPAEFLERAEPARARVSARRRRR